jgi:DinB superfamily
MGAILNISTKATDKNIKIVLDALAETPKSLGGLAAALGPESLNLPLEAGEWSPLEILNHLRACEETNTFRIQAMLALDRPDLPDMHPRMLMRIMPWDRLEFDESFFVFKSRRKDLLMLLNGLMRDGWEREGLIRGKAQNVYRMARGIAHHEAQHIEHWEKKTGSAVV